jgi:hypothetical protein
MLVFDPNQQCRFILVDRPVPVTDFVTKAPVADENGKPLHRYSVLVIRDQGRPAQIRVKAPAVATPLEPGAAVMFQGLSGTLWEKDNTLSVAFRATAIASATQGAKQ